MAKEAVIMNLPSCASAALPASVRRAGVARSARPPPAMNTDTETRRPRRRKEKMETV